MKQKKTMQECIADSVKQTIKVEVNGKIDALSKKIDEHNTKHEADMAEIKPYIQAVTGLGIVFKLFISLGSIAVGWLAIKQIFHI